MMKKILLIVAVSAMAAAVPLFSSDTAGPQSELAKEYYLNGIKYYIKRDFKKATEGFYKALELNPDDKQTKEYMAKAHEKYYRSMELFFNGTECFKNRDYVNAAEYFKQTILINPLHEKAVYYLKLCSTPDVTFAAKKAVFRKNSRENQLLAHVDTEKTVPDWTDSWTISIMDRDNNILRTIRKTGRPPETFIWDLKDDNGNFWDKTEAKCSLTITSFFGRDVTSATNTVLIDRQTPETIMVELPEILFEYNKSELKHSAYPVLDKAGELCKKYNSSQFIIEGHTDSKGPDGYNFDLSRRRADAVYGYLKTRFGIEQAEIKGYGKTKPKTLNDTEEHRQQNRRVVIIIRKD
jgi:outer membrane protein OmpA-like peptidoglycan-associated protein